MDASAKITDIDGNTVGIERLPPADTIRWGFKKKAIVVRAVDAGMLTLREALDRYSMTEREFQLWQKGLEKHGRAGLMNTKFQHIRRAKRQ